MGKTFNDSQSFTDQQIDFTFDRKDYVFVGDYTVNQYGEEWDDENPGDYNATVDFDYIYTLAFYDEGFDLVDEEVSNDILRALEEIIIRNL